MKLSERIRKTGYWAIDKARGGYVRKHFLELKHFEKHPDVMVQTNNERLRSLIHHATSTTSYYQKHIGAESLDDFPVTPKQTIKDNYSDFLSFEFSKQNTIQIRTSGSYGSPFTFYLSKEKKYRQFAEILFFNQKASFYLGRKHANIVTRSKSRFSQFLANQIMVNAVVMDENWLEHQRNMLKNKHVEIIVAHPSALLPIAEYCDRKNDIPDDFDVESIIAIAEPIFPNQRDLLKRVFGAEVFSRYSMMETGVIAQDHLSDRSYSVNTASYVVELLDIDRDEPVQPGHMGRVVVTDLFSHAMPLIRYDTGDLAILSQQNKYTIVLERIIGRTVESVFRPDGVRISPIWIDDVMEDLDAVRLFQFVQKDKDKFVMRIVQGNDYGQESVIDQRLKKILGDNVIIDYEYVNEIPPLPSGKRPFVVNEYYNARLI